jgi:hypothetical protein
MPKINLLSPVTGVNGKDWAFPLPNHGPGSPVLPAADSTAPPGQTKDLPGLPGWYRLNLVFRSADSFINGNPETERKSYGLSHG